AAAAPRPPRSAVALGAGVPRPPRRAPRTAVRQRPGGTAPQGPPARHPDGRGAEGVPAAPLAAGGGTAARRLPRPSRHRLRPARGRRRRRRAGGRGSGVPRLGPPGRCRPAAEGLDQGHLRRAARRHRRRLLRGAGPPVGRSGVAAAGARGGHAGGAGHRRYPRVMRPLIAVTGVPIVAGGVLGWRQGAVACTTAYLEALQRAGGDPVIVPPVPLDEAEAGARLRRFDGVLLVGGGDIDPGLYGQETRPEVAHVNPARDEFEIPLVRAAIARGLPTLCICRGAQVLNVALGGTLHQHISDREDLVAHR